MENPDSRPITVRGAREHNLRGLDVEIPRGRITCLVGVSGSGKSSLLFDTIFVEGQRRYAQALAATSRRGAVPSQRPDVDFVEGLPPTVAIDQRRRSSSPRVTLGTLTDVQDFLRVLWARLGTPHCPVCDRALAQLTPQEMLDRILAAPTGARVQLGAPLGGAHLPARERLALARAEGFVRLRVDGELSDIEEVERALTGDGAPALDVIVDRLIVRDRDRLRGRLADSLEVALRAGGGLAFTLLDLPPHGGELEERWFSERLSCRHCDLELPALASSVFSFTSPAGACPECDGLGCGVCSGSRLGPLGRAVRYAGTTLPAVLSMTPAELLAWICGLETPPAHEPILSPVVREVSARARLLGRVGLGYLRFDRGADTLAGGEISRALLATHCGSSLAGVLYCLDEPTAGLHPRDTDELVGVLTELRDAGNTVVVCEHDLRVLEAADHVIEIGPGAGRLGGTVVYSGALAGLRTVDSATGRALRGELWGELDRATAATARGGRGRLVLRNARGHNLQGIDVEIPLGMLVAVCGPSGSGKSTLISGTLEPALSGGENALPHDDVEGASGLERVARVDPASIARGERSVPATALGIFGPLRELFAATRAARVRGWGRERFSFNTTGGRCEACGGRGSRRVEMELLPDVRVTCEVCQGSRYDRETLEVRFRGLSIADVLDLPAEQAAELFGRIPRIEPLLSTLCEVGLGYIRLGQPVATLSSGERQRLKLAAELGKSRSLQGSIFLLDEPTLGLHPADVATLIALLRRLIDGGASIVCVEHNLDLLRAADHLIELGPGGGPDGGRLVASGSPEDLRGCTLSPTGGYL